MAQDRVLAQRIVNVLNEAFAADADAMHNLIETRVPINDKLAHHPTIQCVAIDERGVKPRYAFGILGLLNGLCGVNEHGWGPVAASFNDDVNSPSFGKLEKFILLREDAGNKVATP
jgi:hypothetical protein